MRYIAALTVLGLGACAGPQTALQPNIHTVEVKVPTPMPCPALERLGPEPAYPDSDAVIAAAGTIGDLAALYAAGRKLRVQRLLEYSVAKASCIF